MHSKTCSAERVTFGFESSRGVDNVFSTVLWMSGSFTKIPSSWILFTYCIVATFYHLVGFTSTTQAKGRIHNQLKQRMSLLLAGEKENRKETSFAAKQS